MGVYHGTTITVHVFPSLKYKVIQLLTGSNGFHLPPCIFISSKHPNAKQD